MMAVVWKRGCSRIMAASSNPSRSGMHTSIRINATSFLSSTSNAWRADEALRRFSPTSARIASWLISLAWLSSTSRIFTFSTAFMGATCSAMQPHAQGGQQLLDIHGFREVVRGSGLEAFLAVALHGLCRQCQNGQAAEAGVLANHFDGLVPVHARHHDVHQNDGHVGTRLQHRDGLAAGGRRQYLHPAPLEDAGERENVAGIVVDQKNGPLHEILIGA